MDLNEIDWGAQVPLCTGSVHCKVCKALNATFPCSTIARSAIDGRNKYRQNLATEMTLLMRIKAEMN